MKRGSWIVTTRALCLILPEMGHLGQDSRQKERGCLGRITSFNHTSEKTALRAAPGFFFQDHTTTLSILVAYCLPVCHLSAHQTITKKPMKVVLSKRPKRQHKGKGAENAASGVLLDLQELLGTANWLAQSR